MSDSSADPIFGPLNEPQKAAVEHQDGPLLILAGAGSGKTRALTHRIARLMRDGVQPWQILAVTFTNKAASEMKERIGNMVSGLSPDGMLELENKQANLPVMGTFHAICARMLRRDIEHIGRDRSFVIYDSDDQQKLVKEILKDMRIDDKELKPKAVLGYIGRFKCESVGPTEASADANTERMHRVIEVYKRYQKALFEANALDFDDLILETVRLLKEVPEVRERYQRTWRYIHVDEYQDTNHAQYLLISLLAGAHRNLCVIGDPDQSIYSFRGADIRNILEFEKEYPDAVHIKLEQNYRSTQPILTASDHVIAHNPNRPEKNMWTERTEGPNLILQETSDEKREAQVAIKSIQELQSKQKVPLRNQAVLYRTNAQSRLIEEACMRGGIPYRIVGGVKFYARREVKDVLAYLRVILNPNDTVSLLRIINVPARKIGQTTLGRLQAFASEQSLTLWESLQRANEVPDINEPTKNRIHRFTDSIEQYQKRIDNDVVAELSLQLIDSIGLETWLRDDTQEGEERWQNVQELLTVMRKYNQLEPRLSLTSFLEEVALVSEVDQLTEQSDALTLMTLHLCKGLEFEHVVITGCEEGIFPHSNSAFDKEQLEEERRLMYVGMTRAKTHLQLLHARTRMQWGNMQHNAPSRFLDDIPEELVERRSDDVLSAFAWASARGDRMARENTMESISKRMVEPFRQNTEEEKDPGFSIDTDDFNQETHYETGSRIAHPTFGEGTITSLRGDVADILFDSGNRKTIALRIAPIRLL